MFEKKPEPAKGGAPSSKGGDSQSGTAADGFPSIGGTLGVSGQQFRDILKIIQVQNEGGFVLEVVNEESPEVKEQVEKEIKQAELTKAAAKEKQEFMENLITAVSSNVLFKSNPKRQSNQTIRKIISYCKIAMSSSVL